MTYDERYYSNPRLEMAAEDYAPEEWPDDHDLDDIPDEEGDDDE